MQTTDFKTVLPIFVRQASVCVSFGPRVEMFIAIAGKNGAEGRVLQFTLDGGLWICTSENVKISPVAKTYAPGNIVAVLDNAGYRTVLDEWYVYWRFFSILLTAQFTDSQIKLHCLCLF